MEKIYGFYAFKTYGRKGVLKKENSHFYMSVEREEYYEKMVTDFMDTYCQSSFPKLVEMYLKQNGISKQDAGYVMNLIRTYTK